MFETGQIIGRNYKILSQLGEGGMGQVYKALDVNLGREVAVKFLLPEIAKDKEIVKRFLNEGKIMATINHSAVISVYASDVEESNGIPFLVMEFVDGESLGDCEERLRKDPTELIKHFIQLLSGIHSCHQKGIVHRDLKPDNLLINSDGQLKIVDFGIAKSATKQTKTGIALGTPHYMSPEQCLGKQDITAKADVYATGIMLFEIITGALPFRTDGHVDDPALTIALMHLNQAPNFEDFAKHPMGPEFKHLVEKMLEKKADDRPEVPETLEELKSILRRLMDSEKPTMAKEAVKAGDDKTIGEIYRIQSELGTGGMGKVYKALDTALNRTVAIKVLHDSTTKDDSLVERFIHEGQVLATVGHRNVMGIYASSRDKRTGRPFLVMEYIEGKCLSKMKDYLAKDRTKAVPIMLQLVEGLSACHEKGIIHRDLKPANIIITNSGLVKILDFGIAKTGTNLTKTGMTVGTPEYMSPEQCTGSKNISAKSDIYALGIIFWELIFGSVPFKADANTNPELSIALKHIEATLPAQAAIPDLTLVKIISLAKKMLDKDPESRPDMDIIMQTLEDFMDEHMPEQSMGNTSGSRSSRQYSKSVSKLMQPSEMKKTSRSLAIPMVFLLLLVAGALIWKFNLIGSKPSINYEKEINNKITSGQFVAAKKLLNEFQLTETGKVRGSFLKVALNKAMLKRADTYSANLDYQKAIDLYAQAIVLDPANPQAALKLSRLQQDFQKVEQQKVRIEELKHQANALLSYIEPASGSSELKACLEELKALNVATFSQNIEARWQTKFIASASPFITTQPEKALQYLDELQKYFSELKGVKELADKARQKSQELKMELANANKVNSLKTALSAAIENYTSSQKIDFLNQQIDKVAQLGEPDEADSLRKSLGQKIAREAEKYIVNNPQKAIEMLKTAENTFPGIEGLQTKLQLASESMAALRTSAEVKMERDNLFQEISSDIVKIAPPAAIAAIVSKLSKLEKYHEGAPKARNLRNKLFDKYFSSVSTELEKSPETAKVILAFCTELNPGAPGLKEIGKNIEEKIKQESARKKAEKEKQRSKRLEVAKSAIYTGIKKDKIPENLEKIFTEITALSKEYPDSDAPEKLMEHLKNRCRSEIKAFSKSNFEKAAKTIEISRKLFQDDKNLISFLDLTTTKIANYEKQAEKKRAVAQQQKDIESFIKSPRKDKIASLMANIKQIREIVSEKEAQQVLSSVTKSLKKRFDDSENPAQATANFELLQAVDKDLTGSPAEAVAKLAEKKTLPIQNFAQAFKPAKDVSELLAQLKQFEIWDAQEAQIQTIKAIKQSYIKEINKVSESSPQDGLELLSGLMKLPGMGNNSELNTLSASLTKGAESSQQSDKKLQNMLETAKGIFDQGIIIERSEQLFEIIKFLESNSPPNAKELRKQIVVKLLASAEMVLSGNDIKGAEKRVVLAKQFDPSNESAQKLQIRIVEIKKAAEKPKHFVVGPTGNFKNINAAINAAPEGMTIKVQPGTYNENLNLTKTVKLIGESSSRCSVNSSSGSTITIQGNSSISNLTITNSAPSPNATVFITSGSPEIKSCILSNSSPAKSPNYHGVITISGGAPVISSNQLNACKGMGITVTGGSPIISQNTISGCNIYGMWFNGKSRSQVTENTIKNNSKSGVGVKNGAAPNFTANLIEANGENGFLVYAGARGKYEGNKLSNNSLSGIEVWDSQPDSIRNNFFDGNRRDALFIRGGKAVVRLGTNQFKNTNGQDVKNNGGKIVPL